MRHGIAGTTIAKVVELAEVSMGMVNVHFSSKDELLREVLKQMAEDYNRHWLKVLDETPANPAEQLKALVLADFDETVLNLETIGVWFAFRAQVRASSEYLDLVSNREQLHIRKMVSLIKKLNKEGGYQHPPKLVAHGIIAVQEGTWTDFFLNPEEFSRKNAIKFIFLILNALFPKHF